MVGRLSAVLKKPGPVQRILEMLEQPDQFLARRDSDRARR